MATPLEALQAQAGKVKTKLDASTTAFANTVSPTRGDLGLADRYTSINKQIEDLKSKQIRSKWYGPSSVTEDSGSSDGVFMKGLKGLQRPLNVIAGTAQYALGDGTSPSYTESVNKAMESGLTFGNILEKKGMSKVGSIPLGFALDVMFDPVNWATVGTAALLPRIGFGLAKGTAEKGLLEGGLKAAARGAESSLAKKAAFTMNLVPKSIREAVPSYAKAAEKVGARAAKTSAEYDSLIGTTAADRIGKGLLGIDAIQSRKVGNFVNRMIEKIPETRFTPSGAKIAEKMRYSVGRSVAMTNLQDDIVRAYKSEGLKYTKNPKKADFASFSDFYSRDATVMRDQTDKLVKNAIAQADGVPDETGKVAVYIRDRNTGELLPQFRDKIRIADNIDNAKEILLATKYQGDTRLLTEAYKEIPRGRTGWEWYDGVLDKLEKTTVDDLLHRRLAGPQAKEAITADAEKLIKDWNFIEQAKNAIANPRAFKPFEAFLKTHRLFTAIFKLAKVPMNVASHQIATLGNMTMAWMNGIPIWDPEYMKAVQQAALIVKGRAGTKALLDTFVSDSRMLLHMAENNPVRFRHTFGVDASEIIRKVDLAKQGEAWKGFSGASASQIEKKLLEGFEAAFKSVEQQKDIVKKAALDPNSEEAKFIALKYDELQKSAEFKFKTGSETLRDVEGVPRKSDMGSGVLENELTAITDSNILDQMREITSQWAKDHPYNPLIRATNTLVNSMPRWYEQIDQTFKLATTDYLSRVGVSEANLKIIARNVPVDMTNDVIGTVERGGETYYRLSALKASEVALDTFMDYSAMPDFVRVVRALPIVGAPFYSFPYAMALKSGKTAINNPALFNKVGFMMNEITGLRSPQEKAAMEEKYNQYLQSPTVMRLFGKWNTDVKNWVPYFTMNMFNPSERKYDDSFNGQMMKLADKFPIMQDPIGQTFKDFFIQPWLLSGSEIPQGQFGQPLYPTFNEKGKRIKPSLGTKAFYASRNLAETVVPGSLSLAGPLLSGLSPEAIEYIPSYGVRSTALAAQGRSSTGAMTKEDAVRKMLRSLSSKVGVPLYTLDPNTSSTRR